jgi:hypothetical protein
MPGVPPPPAHCFSTWTGSRMTRRNGTASTPPMPRNLSKASAAW